MKIDGQCHCGNVTYEAEVNPDFVVICHCEDCQRFSGAPYRANVFVKRENFKMQGTPRTYVKTAESGNRLGVAFCGECGTSLYSSNLENPERINLRLGSVRQRAELTPRAQFFCRSAMPWVFSLGDIPQSPDQRFPQAALKDQTPANARG